MEPLLSLRTFIDKAIAKDEITHINGADWDLEIGAIAVG